jgi:UMF1 family MFS transporter
MAKSGLIWYNSFITALREKRMKFKLTKQEKSWVLYDVGNSAFVMIICSLLPIYYNNLATAQGYSESQITAIFGTLLSLSAFCIALINPILGAIADNRGMKKKMFTVFMLIGVIGCLSLGVSKSIPYLAAIVIVSRLGMTGSVVFYDSMLVDIAPENRMDNVSAEDLPGIYRQLYTFYPLFASIRSLYHAR